MESKRFTLNRADFEYTYERGKIFLASLILIYVAGLIPKIQGDGLQLADFGLNEFEKGALVLFFLNRLQTLLMQFVAGKK